MFTDTASSLRLIMCCVVCGFAFGVIYDFLRAFRPKKAPLLNFFTDTVFVLSFFVCLFLMGCTAGQGSQRLYALAFCLASSALYFAALSPNFRFVFNRLAGFVRKILSFLLRPFKFLLKCVKKLCKISKNFFYSRKICYTIKSTRKNANKEHTAHPYEKGNTDETEKGRYYY